MGGAGPVSAVVKRGGKCVNWLGSRENAAPAPPSTPARLGGGLRPSSQVACVPETHHLDKPRCQMNGNGASWGRTLPGSGAFGT